MTDWSTTIGSGTAWRAPSSATTSWSDASGNVTLWTTPAEYSETTTGGDGTPIGLLLTITLGTGITTYPTSSDMEWTSQTNNQTAWRT